MNYYFEVLNEYAEFNGRVKRKKYWMFTLISFVISIILRLISPVLLGIYGLVVLLPGLAVTIRRLHDTNRSGWWVLINIIPLIGPIIFLVFMVQDSTSGENKYDSKPKIQSQNNQVNTNNFKQNNLNSKEKLALENSKVECNECGEMVNTEVDFCSNCGNELTSERKQTCYNCDSVIEEYARFCPECGVELVMSCPECETELDPKTKFCSNCGFNFESDNNDDRGSEEETGP
ncbi:Uncharacterized membrane protein YhaH, DUF805 family [Selenihalanaerobacter shriftii]|uniref:Uncharacterized membrane protein YhaH, DUF805 family n=2 Tax=Selenihalanaerobacter shriftii TaxID=142842 RepID=A0A1T4NWA9_9FIRM|nr:DUF805 domain-containing protein [Selenihalanaerobacter shriftii]SJZ83529.1 Uncharacterized membrane protein YhaH, DUF805 family [Selenihalanaerobacter shriftii]